MGELISFARARAARRPTPPARPIEVDHGAVPDPARRVGKAVGVPPAERHDQLGVGREPLWREVCGAVLRDERRRQGRTLADVAGRAGMSVQHLSEVERGRKEASSEMLAAAAGSLGLTLGEVARRCAFALAPAGAPRGPVLLAA